MNHSWGDHHFPRSGTAQTNDKWSNYHQYPQHPGPATYNNYNNNHQEHGGSSSSQSTAEWDRPGSSSQKCHSFEPEAEEDPDGLPYEPDSEDPELLRKRKALQVIEEQIILKKASIALKSMNVKPSVKRRRFTEEPEYKKTLRERVKHILLERNRKFRTYSSVAKSRRRSLNVRNDHPLKWKVEAALQQRFDAPPVQPQKCKPIPPLSSSALHQTVHSAENEAQKSDHGFMRFLSVLNKGVDISKLTELVKDGTDRLPHSSQNSFQTHTSSQHPKTEEQQKQNIFELLGLNLGTGKINCLDDRTRHSSDSSSSSSSSDQSSSRTPSPVRRRRSPSPVHRKRSHSPYRKKDSHSNESWRQEVHPNIYPQYPPPMPPYPYPTPPYFNPHIPPPMYPPAYSYSQHIAYYNHWGYGQAPPPFNPNYQQTQLPPPSQHMPPLPPPNVPINKDWGRSGDGSNECLLPKSQGLSNNNSGSSFIPFSKIPELAANKSHLLSQEEKQLIKKEMRRQLYKARSAKRQEKNPEEKKRLGEKVAYIFKSIQLAKVGIIADTDSFAPPNPPKPKLSKKQKKKQNIQRKKERMERRLKEKAGHGSLPVAPVKEQSIKEESEPEKRKKKLGAFDNCIKNNVSQSPVNIEGKDDN